ncbi:MAG: hypothetical protein RBU21_00775 [FCB group bacterium]|nr:hypothetical protein [FCB group bacterium]
MMARITSVWMVAGLVLALGMAVPANAESVVHGRVSYESGGGMVKGTADADWGFATVNTLVLPGDTLWADSGALLEAEFNGGTFLRLADQSKADVVGLPPNTVFKGWTGSFYVHRVARSTGNVLFQTPACQISVERDSQVRIDVLETGATTVTVRWGRATVGTDGGQGVTVSTAQRSFVDPGYLPSVPQRYDTSAEDDFDAWSRERARLVAVGEKAIPSTYRVTSAPLGTSDLANYGDWVYVDNTPYWRPTVVTNYVPYRQGIWSYTPGCGYVWVGDYPFSYVTSHYGRWNYNPGYGWLWGYTDVWGPAWVASVRCGPYFAWAPLDMHGYPVRYGSSVFDFGSFSLTVGAGSYCLADNLLYGYSYGRPVTSPIFSNISDNNVYVWNVTGNNVTVNFPWAGNMPVRGYKPQRVMRGPDTLEAGERVIRAGERASRLESSIGRRDFSTVERTGDRAIRTSTGTRTREARMRDVGVGTARTMEGARTSERVARALDSPEVRRTREEAREGRSLATTEGRETSRASRDAERTRGDRTTDTGGMAEVTERATRGTRTIGSDPDATTERGTTTRGNRGAAISGERTAPQEGIRTERSIGTESRGNRTSAIEGNDRAVTDANRSASTRTEARTAPRSISLGNSNRSAGQRTERVAAPPSTASRGTDRGMSTTPRSMERTAPTSRTVERSAPSRSMERTAPATPRIAERTAPPAQRYESAPRGIQRSEAPAPRVTTIPRSEPRRSAPVISQPAPVRQQVEAPRRIETPAPRVQERAPAVQPQRAPEIQRRMEMPRATERRQEAPRVEAPRMEAPQRVERNLGGGDGPSINRGGMDRGNSHRSR